MTATTQAFSTDEIDEKLKAIVDDFLVDFDEEFDEDVTRQTKLLADLGFESIDVIQLVVAIEEDFGTRGLGFEDLLMVDGRYVDDLSVGQIADFLGQRL